MLSHNMFTQKIDDFNLISEMPKHVAAQFSVDRYEQQRLSFVYRWPHRMQLIMDSNANYLLIISPPVQLAP